MRRFSIPCLFGSEKRLFDFYVGNPSPGLPALKYQAVWLLENRSGRIPPEVLDSFAKLRQMALDNDVDFEELCAYALMEASVLQREERRA
jgi:hypothetical protein